MMKAETFPHVPAAFINNIRDEGTKAEACDWLQKLWNETCYLRDQLAEADRHAIKIETLLEPHIKWDDPLKLNLRRRE